MQYNTIAVGGTFDRLHKGHEAFLRFAFLKGEKVLIGITTDEFVSENKNGNDIESFEKRKQSVITFLENNHLLPRALVMPIDSIFGPTLSKGVVIDGLVVTENTQEGAKKINRKRQENGLSIIPIIVAPLIKVGNAVVSSTKIRKGEISKSGEQFIDPKWYSVSYRMPEGLRLLLHKPFGKLSQNNLKNLKNIPQEKIVTVGDVTTKNFLQKGIVPVISIIDFIVERKRKYSSIQDLGFTGNENVYHMSNPPSTISSEIWMILKDFIEYRKEKKSNIILVDGEEDLLVLPLILMLPLGFFIFYGQPKVGYVQIEITATLKEETKNLFALFKEIL